MSVIIRLQNLPWSANALDIRQFFSGLSIPEGGVHIVGGELGDAFIAFSTDEDARQAFNRTGGKIKEIQVKLLLSSRTEMQKVIEAARSNTYAAFQLPGTPLPAAVPPVMPAAIPEIKREDKRRSRDNKRRSRSKSKERSKERSRDRRRNRDRSRTRSRDRRDRRRRERSRTRSRDRDRSDRRSRDSKKDERKKPEVQQVWANPPEVAMQNLQASLPVFATRSVDLAAAASLLSATNGFPSSAFSNPIAPRQEPWGQSNFMNQPSFMNRDFLANPNGNNQQQQRLNPMLNLGGNGTQNRSNNKPHNYQNSQDGYDEQADDYAVDCCVEVQPFFGGYGEIRRFFQGLFISNRGIKFINDGQGHRTGVAYIQFGHAQGKDDAMKRDGELLNGCKVRVSHLNDDEFDRAVDRFTPADSYSNQRVEDDNSPNFRSKNITKYFNNKNSRVHNNEPELKEFQCVTVDDLPTYVKEQDILHMFSLHPLFSLILTTKPRGGNIAYVKFSTKEVAQKAYEERQHHFVSGKQVSVRPCTEEDFEFINKQHDVDISGSKPTEKIDCIVLTRLPPNSNDRDIADFFSDIGVIPSKVHLVNGPMGFTGQAFCEFDSQDHTNKALKKDDTVFGNVQISVKPSTRKEMLAALGQNIDQKPSPTLPPPPIVNQNRPMVNIDNKPPRMNMNPRMQFPNQRPFFNRNNFGGGPNFVPRGGPRFGPRGGGPRFRFNGPPMNHGNMETPMADMDNAEDAPPGCTVYMDNVPYKASTNEILNFFEGYNVTNNVSRRYNPNNTPSPEAKVVFHTPEEANRAILERNGGQIWDRQIYLTQA
ncbi:unnamed protein product [Brassicogethes aeneus]|uniref:RRM domain-containing protein n=1 Tax=Brassicogethes aeneus TaxID=1431903 RepID=A0A9P0FAN2_BRAAE|nr:unnamed protein product [Brassicogethes aeneus]